MNANTTGLFAGFFFVPFTESALSCCLPRLLCRSKRLFLISLLFSCFAFDHSLASAAEWEMMYQFSVNGASMFRSSAVIIVPDTQPVSLWASTSAITPHLYVSTAGRVGIGTAAPAAALHVVGVSTFTGAVSMNNDQNIYLSTPSRLHVTGGVTDQVLANDGANALKWIDVSKLGGDNLGNHVATTTLNMGNFGIINIASASVNLGLTVLGTSTLSGVTGAGYITVSSLTSSGQVTVYSTVTIMAPVTATSSLWISTSMVTPHLYVSTGGNIGIGTASPQTSLMIESGYPRAELSVNLNGEVTAYNRWGYNNWAVSYWAQNAIWTGTQWNTLSNGYGGQSVLQQQNHGTYELSVSASQASPAPFRTQIFVSSGSGVSIGMRTEPQGALDVKALGSAVTDMAQIWRNSTEVIQASMSATGVIKAKYFIGNGSQLTNLPGASPVGSALTTGNIWVGVAGLAASVAMFDATNPAALGTAAPGSAATAAHRDHVHKAADLSNTETTGILTPAKGGTGTNTTATSGNYLKGNGTNWVTSTGDASGVGACGANTWASTLNSDAVPTCTQPAFSNLSGAATLAQLPYGTANQILGANNAGGAAEWKTFSVGTTGTNFNIALTGANAVVFHLPDASATNRGAVTIGAQTFAGAKTFSSVIAAPTLTLTPTASAPTAVEGGTYYDSTQHRLYVSTAANSGAWLLLGPLTSCPSGMVLVGSGRSAYCIETADRGTALYEVATNACLNEGRYLCDLHEFGMACYNNSWSTAATRWVSSMYATANGGIMKTAATNCFSASQMTFSAAASNPYRCCLR